MLQRELSHMDRITQLQDETQQLLTIMASSIAYPHLSHRFRPNKYDSTEIFQGHARDSRDEMSLTHFILQRIAKSLQSISLSKPSRSTEMTVVNDEYIQAVARSKDLQVQITD
ncbi:hypothetical protein B0H14DRAFT_2913928, partial [Mycena olivaceomarginata]